MQQSVLSVQQPTNVLTSHRDNGDAANLLI